MPAACRISHTVEAAIACPSRASSPWILLWPQAEFSRAIRTIGVLTEVPVDGRPGFRRSVYVHLRATRSRCQRRIVAGVTGKTSGHRRRLTSRDSAADAAEVHPAGAVLDENQHVQPLQQHGVHMQEADREDPGRLSVQELPPGRPRTCPSRLTCASATATTLQNTTAPPVRIFSVPPITSADRSPPPRSRHRKPPSSDSP